MLLRNPYSCNNAVQEYKFLHDRVQQAAGVAESGYEPLARDSETPCNILRNHPTIQQRQAAYVLIDESQKQVVHLQIGHNLFEKTSPEQRSDRLFEIIDHLNQGLELVTTGSEQVEIARLNLMAGERAKAATAYEAAFKYFNTGLKLLNSESWQSEYDLTFWLTDKT